MTSGAGPFRRFLPGVVLGGICLGAALLAGCGGDELREHLARGQEHLEAERYEEAQLEGLYVLLRDPKSVDALHLVAYSLLAQDRDGEAEAYFRTLAEIDPLYTTQAAALYDERARWDFEHGEKRRASRRWFVALDFDAERELGPYSFFMAQQAFERRDWEKAVALFSRALASHPDSSAVKTSLFPYGVSLHRLEYWSESLLVLEAFLRTYPRHRQRHEALWLYQELLIHEGQAAAQRMNYEGAVELLRKALRYDDNPPKTAEALLALGGCYENLQDYGAAASCYRRIVEGDGGGRIYDAAIARLETLEKARLK